MFEAMKAAGAIAGLMKNREAIAAGMTRVQATLDTVRVVGEAGTGAVRVTMNGKMLVTEVHIEPAMFGARDEATMTLVRTMFIEATNKASEKAREVAAREMSREAQALGLGDMPGLSALLGGQGA